MYLGADLAPLGQVRLRDSAAIITASSKIWRSVQTSEPAARAEALAEQITAHRPTLIALQEAALWRSQFPSRGVLANPSAEHVEYDFVALVLRALERRGVHYASIAEGVTMDAQLPFRDARGVGDLRFTDRQVVLARSDLTTKGLRVVAQSSGLFRARYAPKAIPQGIPRGWVSVDIQADGHTLRFINTHLESQNARINKAQGLELAELVLGAPNEVIVVGDLNADADTRDRSSTYRALTRAGLHDVWRVSEPKRAGATCCRNPFDGGQLKSRIDVILARGFERVATANLLGTDKPISRTRWISDHAGVTAELVFGAPITASDKD
jgi:endonuclease/exonuclease/phosphatase family metal-dependent hydrolase